MKRLPVLIVNDDRSLAETISAAAKEGGYKHYVATTAADALHLASLYDFSLAFIDLQLPDMGGADFYRKLLEKESHYTLAVVSFLDGLDAHEVQAVNELVAQGQLTLLSKPPRKEWLQDLFSRYAAPEV